MAEQVTLVVPKLNVLLEGRVHDDESIPELSTAEKVHEAEAVGELPFVGVTTRGDDVVYGGQVKVGGETSVLEIVIKQAEVLLALSVAVH